MRAIHRRWRAGHLAAVSFCDACCRADAVADRARTTAPAFPAGPR